MEIVKDRDAAKEKKTCSEGAYMPIALIKMFIGIMKNRIYDGSGGGAVSQGGEREKKN